MAIQNIQCYRYRHVYQGRHCCKRYFELNDFRVKDQMSLHYYLIPYMHNLEQYSIRKNIC